jgi:dTDP-4-amino-4,6-dideoxygalactose transaminase
MQGLKKLAKNQQAKIERIPFNRPHVTGREFAYIQEAINSHQLSGNGGFTKRCHELLQIETDCLQAFLTHSATAALEMAALLINLEEGDEVIMPSFTFVSTANAFVLRGAVPVFVDIRKDTLNIDEELIANAITTKTKAIVPVHYAGVVCNMDDIISVAQDNHLCVIEDAAHAVRSTFNGQSAGSFGQLTALSFHETKNVISGEGGALLVNDEELFERASILWEKGTNRKQFFSGQTDKYTWVDKGSSFLPSEIIAAFLLAQLEESEQITQQRLAIWNDYHAQLLPLETKGYLRRPIVPEGCVQNGHMYYVILNSPEERTALLAYLNERDINAVFHYIPLHNSPAGKKYSRYVGDMSITNHISSCLLRLPMWVGLQPHQIEQTVSGIADYFGIKS